MKFQSRKILLLSRLLFMFGTLALLCGFAEVKPAAAATPAFIRVLHASPDIGTADVFVDGTVLLSSFQFGAITDYAPIPPGPHAVQIALLGKGIGGAVITQSLAVSPGIAYTVAATGTKATGLGLEVFIDNNVVSGSMAKIRVYQLSPDAGNVTVSDGSSTVLSGIIYRQASGYVTIPASSYTFNVSSANLSGSLPVSVSLKPDSVTSIFAVGLVNGTPNIQLVSSQANGTPGLPNTGSNPNGGTKTGHLQTWSLWLLAVLLIIAIGFGALFVGREMVRKVAALHIES